MAQEVNGVIKTFKAFAASIAAYRIVAAGTGKNVARLADTSTCFLIGVSANDISATGQALSVVLNGTAKCMCGASVSSGALLSFQTDTGKCIEALASAYNHTTTTIIPRTIGVALQAGSTNSVIEILVNPNNVKFNL